MNSRELVWRAIERTGPSRVPVHHCNRDLEQADTYTLSFAPAEGFSPSEKGMTEWGYIWESLNDTMGQPRSHPLAEPGALAHYCPPDPYAPGRLAGLAQAAEAHRDHFVRFGLGITGFNIATFLRGFEALLENLVLDRAQAERILDMVFDFENAMIEQACALPVDCIVFGDDWGTQRGLMVAPKLWRAVFRTRYQQQFARIHQAGKKRCGSTPAATCRRSSPT